MIRATSVVLCCVLSPAMAEVPVVVTDIAPVHSLTAQVMAGVGDPALLVPSNADPHDFALRPSDADRLAAADILIWIGPDLTPWLEDPLATMATQAAVLTLLDTPGWDRLPRRDLGDFGADHGHDDDHGDTVEDDHDDHGHDEGGSDPHAWLDPAVATVWLTEIATALSAADPVNAQTYQDNAAAAAADLAALQAIIAARLAPLAGQALVVPHDAFQYFETRFGLQVSGAVTLSDAATPGPAQIAALRDMIATTDVACVLHGPGDDKWAGVLTEGSAARTGVVDDIGLGLTEGPALYGDLLTSIADGLGDCLP